MELLNTFKELKSFKIFFWKRLKYKILSPFGTCNNALTSNQKRQSAAFIAKQRKNLAFAPVPLFVAEVRIISLRYYKSLSGAWHLNYLLLLPDYERAV